MSLSIIIHLHVMLFKMYFFIKKMVQLKKIVMNYIIIILIFIVILDHIQHIQWYNIHYPLDLYSLFETNYIHFKSYNSDNFPS